MTDGNDAAIGADRLGATGDLFYEKLLKSHAGLEREASERLNMRLVLLMANAIGDPGTLDKLLLAAQDATND